MSKVLLKSGLRLHVQEAGKGPPDMVMIHGLTGNLAVWHLKMAPLLWDHCRMVTYDLRGHGYSDMPPSGYTAGDMATDLEELLDAMGIEQTYLVGHSYGADIALYFTVRHPRRVKRVVAIEPGLPALVELRKDQDWEGLRYWCEVLEKSGFSVPPEHRTDVAYLLHRSLELPKRWGPLNGLPRNPKPTLRLFETTTMPQDYEVIGDLTLEAIGRIQTPVMLVCGDRSAFLGSHIYLREHLPNVREVMLPRTEWGHFGPLEQPEAVAEHIRSWLEEDKRPVATTDGSGKLSAEVQRA